MMRFIILAYMYFSNKDETFRFAQFPNLIGLMIYFGTNPNPLKEEIDQTSLVVLGVLTSISILLFFWYGECDFATAEGVAVTGAYGVGCKRFWAKKNGNHVMVYYPISKENEAWKEGKYTLSYDLWGEEEEVATSKGVTWLMKLKFEIPPGHFYAGAKIEAIENARIDISKEGN